jgi:hypothetical protein
MYLLPIARMLQRVEAAKQDSDTDYFINLMYLGELITKITTAALVAAIVNDKDRHRYRQLHRLVRADGIGQWAEVLDDTLTGLASQFLQRQARIEQKELTQRMKAGAWQYEAVSLLNLSLKFLGQAREETSTKVDGRRWFTLFAELRNKTRGHGAPTSAVCSKVAPILAKSIMIVIDNLGLFGRPWVYLQRNLSGKYRVTKLGDSAGEFDYLRSDRSATWENGIYTFFDRPTPVELASSDPEISDFFLPNGGFKGKRFEILSYISGTTAESDASPYLIPATELPPSETEGIGYLEIQGRVFGNLPPVVAGYVNRPELQEDLKKKLLDDRHPVITLAGRGGIGKTSAALATLYSIAEDNRFGALLWFSARDVDLLQEGPKIVRSHILTESDIATEFIRLLCPAEESKDDFDPLKYLANSLSASPLGDPILFVVDNFETVRNPVEVYAWLDTYIRLPNKLLITTRFRDFKADYPLEVLGMTDSESKELISSTAHELGIRKLLSDDYKNDIVRESDGHPYVIKILLGEVAKAGAQVAIKRIIATKEDILPALFERTFAGLSPAARRVFLLLSSWRSVIPELAIQAVLMRPAVDPMDVEDALDELTRSSLIEITYSKDKRKFISLPLAAFEFGKKKLAVSASKSAVEADLELLKMFGTGQKTDVVHGIAPRINRLFRFVEQRMNREGGEIRNYLPILEFIAQQYTPGWLLLASLWEASDVVDKYDRAKDALRSYLEKTHASEQRVAWERLANLSAKTEDYLGEAHARVALAEMADTTFEAISDTANFINALTAREQFLDTEERRILVSRLANLMEAHLKEADATDLSRLAWLYLQMHDDERGFELAEAGLKLDPHNEYCQKLLMRRR